MGESKSRQSEQTGSRDRETSGVWQSRQSEGKKAAERLLRTVLKGATRLARGSTRRTRCFLVTVSQLLKTDLRFQVSAQETHSIWLAGEYRHSKYKNFAAVPQCRWRFGPDIHRFSLGNRIDCVLSVLAVTFYHPSFPGVANQRGAP